MEYYAALGSIADAKERVAQWMKPEEAPLSKRLAETGHQGKIFREPYGVCLIVAPFKALLALTFDPLVAALSAGNTVVVKPSNRTPNTSLLIEKLVTRYFQPDAVVVVNGDRVVLTELLTFPFDFIFFAGSTHVGRIVMRAAAEHLAPVLLELGGQSPVVVDETARLKLSPATNRSRPITHPSFFHWKSWLLSPITVLTS
jgi:aldehyde dehydrogenase (NAD+)